MPTALVTGATSGIGRAFAERLAAGGHDLVLVARDEQRLATTARELAQRHGVGVDVLMADLGTIEGMSAVEQRLSDDGRPIDLLVNNAGYGLRRGFLANDVDDEDRMQAVLVRAVLRLSHVAVRGMVDRGGGAIVNVSSVAGWVPRGTYSAAKAWVTAFSEGIAPAMARNGVRVMVLAPGFTRTEMHERAGIRMDRLPRFMWLEADEVAAIALRDLAKGKVVSVPGAVYRVASWVLPRLPRRAIMSIGRRHPDARRR